MPIIPGVPRISGHESARLPTRPARILSRSATVSRGTPLTSLLKFASSVYTPAAIEAAFWY